MSILPLEIGRKNKILRKISEPLKKIDGKTKKFLQKMLKIVKDDENAVGLAAPQVGENIRAIIAQLGNKYWILVNPIIVQKSEKKICEEEGCLSIPGEFGKVWRSHEITVEFFDEKFQKKKLLLKDFDARIILHEVDHLDGILFVDRMTEKHLAEMKVKHLKHKEL